MLSNSVYAVYTGDELVKLHFLTPLLKLHLQHVCSAASVCVSLSGRTPFRHFDITSKGKF